MIYGEHDFCGLRVRPAPTGDRGLTALLRFEMDAHHESGLTMRCHALLDRRDLELLRDLVEEALA